MPKFRLNAVLLAFVLALQLLQAAPRAQQPGGGQTTAAAAGAAAARAKTTAPAPSGTFAAAREAAKRIKAERMKEVLYFISSDEMAGRDTPSAGLDETAKFIASKLAALKLKPAGDGGSYFQRIALRRIALDPAGSRAEMAGKTFKAGEDFLPGPVSGEAEGALVYAGHGWVIRPRNVNAYDGLDVRDKIVIVAGDGVVPPADLRGLAAADWESPFSYAQKHGARALVLIPRSFERTWRSARARAARIPFRVERSQSAPDSGDEDGEEPADIAQPLTITPSAAMLDALFEGEALSGAQVLRDATEGEPGRGFDLSPSKRLKVTLRMGESRAETQNVVAVLEGRDPVLKNEYVALGAHYDHVSVATGSCRPVPGDSICNGADDDGSGTTAVLAIAEAMSRGPRPKRSVLFIWHTGEEKGLWGSEYFTDSPTVPLQSIVAQLNIDMIGRSKRPGDTSQANRMLTGPDEIYVIGSRMMSTELGDLTEQVNRSYLGLRYNYHYDEPGDPERLFFRSDHYNYARKGIPIVFFFDGVHEDYHRPGDHADKIDYRKMENVTRTIFVLASELANAPRRPAVDKQLPPEHGGH